MIFDSDHGAYLKLQTTTTHNFTFYFTGVAADDLTMANFILYE